MGFESDAEQGISAEKAPLLDKPKPETSRSAWALAAAAAVLFLALSGLLLHGRFSHSVDALGTLAHAPAATPQVLAESAACEGGKLVVGSAALATALPAEVAAFYGKPDFKGRDNPEQFVQEGGQDKKAQIYGEVTPAGMQAMLSHALCLTQHDSAKCTDGADDATAKELAKQYRFFDLGSGAGKFPTAAALMGFQSAHGIELDNHRAGLAGQKKELVLAKYPCLDGTLTLEHGSFTEKVPWTKGAEPRVIFLDAVFFEKIWPEVSKLMKNAEWGPGTVVMSLGREFKEDSGLKRVSKAEFEVSWTKSTRVYFYQRA